MRSLQERFDDKYIPEPTSGCWLWSAMAGGEGYGRIKIGGARHSAHRVSWALHKGAIPSGLHVLHRCDTPACVNPDHLFLGTDADNRADKMRKGRQARGEGISHSKLSRDEVDLIVKDGRPNTRIAADYGVSPSTISLIKRGTVWSFLPRQSPHDLRRAALGIGVYVSNAKLTRGQIYAIRSDGRSQTTIARDFGVSPSTVSRIKSGKIWASTVQAARA